MNRSASTQTPSILTATQNKDWSITTAFLVLHSLLWFEKNKVTLYDHMLYADQGWKKQVDFVFVEYNN